MSAKIFIPIILLALAGCGYVVNGKVYKEHLHECLENNIDKNGFIHEFSIDRCARDARIAAGYQG